MQNNQPRPINEGVNKLKNLFINSFGLFKTEKEWSNFYDCVSFQIQRLTKSSKTWIIIKIHQFWKEIFELINQINKFNDLNPTTKFSNINFKLEFCFDKTNYVLYAKVFKHYFSKRNLEFGGSLFKDEDKSVHFVLDNNNLYVYYWSLAVIRQLEKEKNGLLAWLNDLELDIKDIIFKHDLEQQKKIEQIHLEQSKIKEEIVSSIQAAMNENNFNEKVVDLTNEEITPLSEITKHNSIHDLEKELSKSKLFVCGKVLKYELRAIRDDLKLHKITLVENNQAILLKKFVGQNQNSKWVNKQDLVYWKNTFEKISESYQPWIIARIKPAISPYDKYERTYEQFVGDILDIQIIDKPSNVCKKDEAINKRVELINQTKMSPFESLIEIDELYALANEYGHKAIAITDKNSCQNFAEAYKNSKKFPDIKTIYGVKLELVNKVVEVAKNIQDIELKNATYVVFDIETTGLNPYYCEMIQFFGIKVKNGVEIDRLGFYVNIHKKLSGKTKNLTHINDEQIAAGIEIKQGLIQIKKFFENSILVAHNGINFDLAVLNNSLIKQELEIISEPLIDTLQVSRGINPSFKSHSLKYLSQKYGIDYQDDIAHNAEHDTIKLKELWDELLKQLLESSFTNLNQLNTSLDEFSLKKSDHGNWVVVYAKNQKSLAKLYELISIAHTTRLYKRPKIQWEDILQFKDDLVITNSPTEGDVLYYALNKSDKELIELIKERYDFITIAPSSCFTHSIIREDLFENDYYNAISRIVKICSLLNKKVVASNETYYLTEEEKDDFKILVHSEGLDHKKHKYFKKDETNMEYGSHAYLNTNSMKQALFNITDQQLLDNIVVHWPNEIADSFEKDIKPIVTTLASPETGDEAEKLRTLTYQRLEEKFGKNADPYIKSRVEHELNSVIDHGYAFIYWFSYLLVDASNKDGFIVGSRGSVGSSIVAYLINITEVNPLPAYYLCSRCYYFEWVKSVSSGFNLEDKHCKNLSCDGVLVGDGHNIPFETFMGFKGDKTPDIDLNFSSLYQEKAHNYIQKALGEKHAFRAGTINTIKDKTAYAIIKKYLDEYDVGEAILGSDIHKTAKMNLLITKFENIKRTTGQHPGGIIVVPKNRSIYEFSPVNYPADNKEEDSNWYTTHLPFDLLHDGLLKFDILGHDNPTILKMLSELTGIEPNAIPSYDSKVMQLFNSLNSLNITDPDITKIIKIGTTAIPEFGTNFVKEMLLSVLPQEFSDLIMVSGFSHGTFVWTNNAKDLVEKKIAKISELISVRDDIMTFLIECGVEKLEAFKIMEKVRKGKGLSEEEEKMLNANKNVPSWYAESCKKIQYLFPKAHATAYVIMAWKIAWFKIHHPLAFYASYFSNKTDTCDIEAFLDGKKGLIKKINELNRKKKDGAELNAKDKNLVMLYEAALEMVGRGFVFHKVDLDHSHYEQWLIKDNGLLLPFSSITGLGTVVGKSICDARVEKPFESIQDLRERTKINKNHEKIFKELKITKNLK